MMPRGKGISEKDDCGAGGRGAGESGRHGDDCPHRRVRAYHRQYRRNDFESTILLGPCHQAPRIYNAGEAFWIGRSRLRERPESGPLYH